MLYLGIDQHGKQLTISLRDEEGTVILRRQVSTKPERIEAFFEGLCALAEPAGGFLAILEVCGFNDWLLKRLRQAGCLKVVLMHPEKRSRRKTDRRDAQALSELLWLNRHRILQGERTPGLRQVVIPTRLEQQQRELTSQRQRLGRQRTRCLNQIQGLLRRHNLTWECPTQSFQTQAVDRWLRELTTSVKLTRLERMHLSHWLAQKELLESQIEELNELIVRYARHSESVSLLRSMPGVGAYSGLALASRIGKIQRFPRPRSLANYFGLTPSCRNSGETTDRLGSITKDGSRLARFILGQLVLHVLKRDPQLREWYRGIKVRRGSKIARVAVMRRLTTVMWQMLTHRRPYEIGGAPQEIQKVSSSESVKNHAQARQKGSPRSRPRHRIGGAG
jgi:transposase